MRLRTHSCHLHATFCVSLLSLMSSPAQYVQHVLCTGHLSFSDPGRLAEVGQAEVSRRSSQSPLGSHRNSKVGDAWGPAARNRAQSLKEAGHWLSYVQMLAERVAGVSYTTAYVLRGWEGNLWRAQRDTKPAPKSAWSFPCRPCCQSFFPSPLEPSQVSLVCSDPLLFLASAPITSMLSLWQEGSCVLCLKPNDSTCTCFEDLYFWETMPKSGQRVGSGGTGVWAWISVLSLVS